MTLPQFIFCLFLCLSNVAQAINLQFANLHEIQLATPITLADKTLGTAIAVSETTAVVAATYSNTKTTGAVYLYDASENWRLSSELTSQVSDDNFARKVALVDNNLFISADRDDNQRGAVYVFERSPTNSQQWQQITKLTAPDGEDGDRFGRALTIVNDKLYIGAPLHQQGKVYIFSRAENQQWQFESSIEPEDVQALRFGEAIAQHNNTLIIGAPYTDANNSTAKNRVIKPRFAISKGDTFDPGTESGAIFVYEKINNNWQYHSRIGATNRETGDHLGEQIAIENDSIIASIKQKDIFDDLRAGAVYVYKKQGDNWLEDTALVADVPNLGGLFGQSIDLFDGHIFVGASKANLQGFSSGQVTIFSKNNSETWQTISWKHPQPLQSHEQLGLSLAVAENHFLVASKNSVRVFQNNPLTDSPANFYSSSNTLQLNEVYVAELGVFKANFQLSKPADSLLLSLTQGELLNDKQDSAIVYSRQTGLLIIPKLAVKNSSNQTVFYAVTLQQVENVTPLQFRVSSLQAINP